MRDTMVVCIRAFLFEGRVLYCLFFTTYHSFSGEGSLKHRACCVVEDLLKQKGKLGGKLPSKPWWL